ncbi:PTS sugar transporter subunit IIA [Candidatus Enterococcus ferrettii]|uniref:PTS EIIA type-2 domain-containing protein n=1 Tax=Candidatus Enterococcus ferrettii TaxID=2815324 RepID=A0ABV0EWA6_9ENTE|nr:PTS sugar transporter subunit IIA [Enterococcus sp. 665A]MBO1339513.1 PTS sugar transporter subunit IIA [Enterococcus sp. 665A]
MSELVNMIKQKNIVFFDEQIDLDKEQLLEKIGCRLFKNGYVKSSFIPAIKEREAAFPTGLNTTTYGIAIPHTDSKHVIEATIAIGVVRTPVIFQEMGAEDVEVPVRLVFMLAIKEPNKQLETLQAVISLIENEEKMKALVQAEDEAAVLQLLN